jgi:RNA polymerase-binding transcription factor DksA
VTESGTSWPAGGPQSRDQGSVGATGPESAKPAAAADTGLAVLEQIERELIEVDAALVRLDDGTYGTCRVCTAAIDDATLAERPTTEVCAAHDSPSPS